MKHSRARTRLRVVTSHLSATSVAGLMATDGAPFVGKKTMQAIQYPEYGHPSVALVMAEVAVPSFRPWEILVEVHAASINPADYKMMQGAFFLIDFVLTHRPGFDVCGKVVAVGSNCSHTKVGDIVYGMSWAYKTGSLAEYIAIDESAVSAAVEGLTAQESAALPLVALTSYNAIVKIGALKKGSRVLVMGGSSATGIMAIQLAKAYGGHVAATCSSRNIALVKSLGADEIVNYTEQDVFEVMRKSGQSFDIIYDTIGTGKEVWEGAASGVLAHGGQLVTITGDVQRDLDIRDLMTRGYQLATRKFYCLTALRGAGYHQYTQPGGNRDDLMVLGSLIKEGKVKAIIDKTYSFDLEQVKEAFKYLMAGKASGKVVITVKGS